MALPNVSGRRAEFDDQASIIQLVGEDEDLLAERFGTRHSAIVSVIENSFLSMVACDEEGAVVGFAAFSDCGAGLSPNVSGGRDFSRWMEWFSSTEATGKHNIANTIWLSYFVSVPELGLDVLEQMLRTVSTSTCASDLL